MRKPLYKRFRKLLPVFGNGDSISCGKNIFEQINVWVLKLINIESISLLAKNKL